MSPLPVLALTATWLVFAAGMAGWGLIFTRVWMRVRSGASLVWRQGLWVGLFAFTCAAMALNVVVPLGSGIAQWIVAIAVVIGLASALWWITRFVQRADSRVRRRVVWSGLGVALIALIFSGWALGQPTNYDTGLYHIGAISYARDFSVIPGLANLHERFGFNSSMWPLSAWLGGVAWFGDEFRLVNGVVLALFVIDLAARLTGVRQRPATPGTVMMLLGAVLILGVFAQYPGRLLASSAQDSAALVLGVASIAYFGDAMSRPRWWDERDTRVSMTVAVIVAVTGALMRPLGWVLVVAIVVVAVGTSLAAGCLPRALRALSPGLLVAVIAGVVVAIRDMLLSGWLIYPAVLVGFPVDWRFPNPAISSDRITAWARTPFQDVDVTLASSQWLGDWLGRLPTDWSIPALGGLLVVAAFLWWRSRGHGSSWASKGMLLTLIPVLALLIAWFITAPDPRFAWGAIIGIGLVPVGFLATHLSMRTVLGGSVALFAVLLVIASLRGSWSQWSWYAVPPQEPTIQVAELADGTKVLVPVGGDQCWNTYPLCRPDYESFDIELRGTDIGAGFRPTTTVPASGA